MMACSASLDDVPRAARTSANKNRIVRKPAIRRAMAPRRVSDSCSPIRIRFVLCSPGGASRLKGPAFLAVVEPSGCAWPSRAVRGQERGQNPVGDGSERTCLGAAWVPGSLRLFLGPLDLRSDQRHGNLSRLCVEVSGRALEVVRRCVAVLVYEFGDPFVPVSRQLTRSCRDHLMSRFALLERVAGTAARDNIAPGMQP